MNCHVLDTVLCDCGITVEHTVNNLNKNYHLTIPQEHATNYIAFSFTFNKE